MGARRRAVLVAAVLAAAPACGGDVFQCSDDGQCAGAGPGAACEPDGYCSVEDDGCPSGRRYGALADGGLAGACVPPVAGGSSGSSSTGSTTTGSQTSSTSLTTSTTADTGSSTTAVTPGSTSAASVGSSGGAWVTQMLQIDASVATCTDVMNNDPAQCEATTLTDGFSVDLVNGPMMLETTGFVAFDFDQVPAGAQIVSATLELTATDTMSAEGPSSGEVWQVEPFTLATLAMGQPTRVGMTALAPDQGAVMISQTVEWSLAVDGLSTQDGLYLAITALSDMGVDYWTTAGMLPPRLFLIVSVPAN